ncbi:helix-turn-helix domain-containing protein [Nonomuraea sp. NPDC050783]|uniref:helix-turn-helix domain-containing protein n=1 Tax=Nonomuraea sp. NPDC050783 TaxID=3154634 RepID=UPI003467E570
MQVLASIIVADPAEAEEVVPPGGRGGPGPAPTGAEPVLGALLRAWRERSLLTQEEVAERAGLNVRTVRRLEAGELRRPRVTSVRLLARALDLDAAERAVLAGAAAGRPAAPRVMLLYVGPPAAGGPGAARAGQR